MSPMHKSHQPRHRIEQIELPESGDLTVVILSDTHGQPHPQLEALIQREKPEAILHAGDLGGRSAGLDLLDRLTRIAPTIAVRGNVDARDLGLFDMITVELVNDGVPALTILLVHVAIARTRLQRTIRDLALLRGADLVICGHSHIPFLGEDRGIAIFNPGSCGPRRFHLPITFGKMVVSHEGVDFTHLDCETGQRWSP